VIQLTNQRFWLYAAVDPDTNEFPYVRLFSTRTIVLTKQFLQEFTEKHDIADSLFLVDDAPWLQAALFELSLRFQHVHMEIGIPSNSCSKNSNAEPRSLPRTSAT
jgi:transposase-like protein